jgi:hypothetical protein
MLFYLVRKEFVMNKEGFGEVGSGRETGETPDFNLGGWNFGND